MSTTVRKVEQKEQHSTFYGIHFDDKYYIWVLLIFVTAQALFNTFGFFFFVVNFMADIFITYFITNTMTNVWEMQTFPLFLFYIIMVVFLEITKKNIKGKSRWIVRNFGNIVSLVLIVVLFVIPTIVSFNLI